MYNKGLNFSYVVLTRELNYPFFMNKGSLRQINFKINDKELILLIPPPPTIPPLFLDKHNTIYNLYITYIHK